MKELKQDAQNIQNEVIKSIEDTSLLLNEMGDSVFIKILDKTLAMLKETNGFIHIYTPANTVRCVAATGTFGAFLGVEVPLESSNIAKYILREQQTLLIDDYSQWQGRKTEDYTRDLRSIMASPLKADKVSGVICVGRVDNEERFTLRDVDLLEGMAELSTIAMDNALLYSRVDKELKLRNQAEESKNRALEVLYTILEKIPVEIHIKDLSGELIYTNREYITDIGGDICFAQNPDCKDGVYPCRSLDFGEESEFEVTRHIDKEDRHYYGLAKKIEWLDKRGVILFVLIDSTENIKTKRALAQSEELFSKAFEYSGHGILIIDLASRKIIKANRYFYDTMGFSKEDIAEVDYRALNIWRDEEDKEKFIKAFRESKFGELEWELYDSKGNTHFFLINYDMVKIEDRDRVLIVAVDITERKRLEERLKVLSHRDTLTGLYNRLYLEEILWKHNYIDGKYVLYMLDVDGLKLINDIFGHYYGDDIIVRVGSILRRVFDTEDVAARVGGDEFVVLARSPKSQKHERIIARLREEIAKENEEDIIPIHISVGYADNSHIKDLFEVLRVADNHMYKDKTKNRIRVMEEHFFYFIDKMKYPMDFDSIESNFMNLIESYSEYMRFDKERRKRLINIALLHNYSRNIRREQYELFLDQLSQKHNTVVEWMMNHEKFYRDNGYLLGITRSDVPYEFMVFVILDNYYTLYLSKTPKDSIAKALVKTQYSIDLKIIKSVLKFFEDRGEWFDQLFKEKDSSS